MPFKTLDETMLVSTQIQPEDVAEAAGRGVTMIVNNRPDGEADDQPRSAEIEAAANAAGIAYRHIPITGLTADAIEAMGRALDEADGTMLAFCKSGTRSTFLWALAQANRGADGETLVQRAADAGYDLGPIRPHLG